MFSEAIGRSRLLRLLAVAGLAVLLFTLAFSVEATAPEDPYSSWSRYAGSADSLQFSSLDQIDQSNVDQLELAWHYAVPGPSSRFGFSPLIVDDVMYVLGADDAIVALDAATGERIWSHATDGTPTDRGINYWESEDRSDRRLIFAVDGVLQEISAVTGETISSFGDSGGVDLREGLGRDPKTIRSIQTGTPGRVFENLILMGSTMGEWYGAAPGDLRAYDVLSGELVWTFHTVPHPGEYGYDTWPKDAWKYSGGANAWSAISIDEERGIAYFPLGSPTYDFYGADRKGENLFGNCLLALDARTGKRLWHFQTVHHDLWDYDLATAPKLLTVRHGGKNVDIVAQPTKYGALYVFDRVTGEPLWPIEERPVPKSDVPGEETWPTQPFPTKPPPYGRLQFTAEDINPYVGEAERERLEKLVLEARNDGLFTPPSLRDTIIMPGEFGGSNWGGAAADPRTGMLYIRSLDAPTLHRMSLKAPVFAFEGGTPEQQGRALYMDRCVMCHGPNGDSIGVTSPALLGPERFRRSIRKGRGRMSGFPGLAPKELDDLAAFLAGPIAVAAEPPKWRDDALIPPSGEVRYYTPYGTLNADNGLPAIGPPWSELTAYDLNEGMIRWRIPLGTVTSLAAEGVDDTGAYHPTRNGLVATAGGLLFIGSWSERKIRAYNKESGAKLWEKKLDSNPEGIPAVYEVAGRQYIAFCTRTGRVFDNIGAESQAWEAGDPEAQGYYVFALPKAAAASGAE